MNSMHGQGQYGYGATQDDFATPFSSDPNNPNTSFGDPNNLFNQNFDNSFEQSMNVDSYSDQSSYLQNIRQQQWQANQFADAPNFAYQNLGGPQAHGFNGLYGGGLSPYPGVNDSFAPYQSPAFTAPQRPQEQQHGTIAPADIETPEDRLWQQQSQPEEDSAPSNLSQHEDGAHSVSQVPLSSGPTRRAFDSSLMEAIGQGLPEEEQQGRLRVRMQPGYSAPATAVPLKNFLYLSKETFETSEGRVVAPTALVRSSANQLKQRLETAPEGCDTETGNRLRKKLENLKAKTFGIKAPKARKAAPSEVHSTVKTQQPIAEESSEEGSETASNDDSDYLSDSDEETDNEPSPLPATRPTDPIEAQEYDIIKTVWARSSSRIRPDDVRARLKTYLDIVRQLRTQWRSAINAQTEAEAKKDGVAAKRLSAVAMRYRNQFEKALRLTIKHGHHNFIESIDQLKPFASTLAVCLNEILKANAYDDSLLEVILQLIVKIPSIDAEFLTGTRLDKYAPKIAKRAQGKIKDFAELIPQQGVKLEQQQVAEKPVKDKLSEERASTVASAPSSKPSLLKKSVEQPTQTVKKSATPSTEIRRVGVVSSTQRKPSPVPASKPAASLPARSINTNKASPGIKPGEKVTSAPASTTAQKIRQVVPTKGPSLYSGLASASKKPGTSNAALKAAAASTQKEQKPPEPKPKPPASAPTAKPTFSFASTLANLNKPKESERKQETVEERAPETEEEKKKRLRKEARRKLRVTWRPDAELCQIKIFDHKHEDEVEHDAAEVADVADLKSEGQAFKRQRNRDIAEEEDEEEQDLIEWKQPRPTDFSNIEASQLQANIETRASGQKQLVSPEAVVQQQREQGVMIVYYTATRDIPLCPREPVDPFNGISKPQYDFGKPKEQVQRLSENYFKEINRANGVPYGDLGQATVTEPSSDISAILRMLGAQNQPPPQAVPQLAQTPQPPQFGASAGNDLQSILAQITGQQTQPTPQPPSNPYQDAINLFNSMQAGQAPPAPMPVQSPPQAPQTSQDLSAILASLSGGSQPPLAPAHQPPQQAPLPPQQQQQQQPQAGAGVSPDILQFLASYNASGTPSQQQTQSLSFGSFGNIQQPYSWQQTQQQQQQQDEIQQQQNLGNERKRGLEEEANGTGSKKKKPFYGVPKVPCRYFKEGKCFKGDKCTFLHE